MSVGSGSIEDGEEIRIPLEVEEARARRGERIDVERDAVGRELAEGEELPVSRVEDGETRPV